MATRPATEEELVARYGPHLNQAPPGGWQRDVDEVDEMVRTHCCFCGQQCSLYLKVADNEVVGFEPDYAFPFNEGKLCPKGVKRYLQGSHTAVQTDGDRNATIQYLPHGKSLTTPGIKD